MGACIVGASLCAAALANSYTELFIALTLLGFGYSTAQPGGSKSVSKWFENGQLGFAMGIRQAALPLGSLLMGGMDLGWLTLRRPLPLIARVCTGNSNDSQPGFGSVGTSDYWSIAR
ncbi:MULTISPECIES: MFS transporter [unclassified Pseudomonas]|uniref:MFS transporter n=1 Tax=unclassified Pseudomonas TaxID=196821 RepID=UPI0035BF2752